jgi:hypothetical protein
MPGKHCDLGLNRGAVTRIKLALSAWDYYGSRLVMPADLRI